ncbi:GNAT family N-acetyltransferase [Microbacterium sp. zg.B48]|uniref:GNAT family N-acetyltransferase n=1 Tax=unclassified Microbacterium TaxID=2609290 RepID=UPI00214B8E51|nr:MULTISPECIES: GNAT family N-acetyltransferase [unclassified Microbacterium]MCR2763332.1 GNAT family N-acetyltransferase [Microbacterium sp. zg.B48]MCR2809055.1 GNAT family N-acetyltransferase [Microbacterium sp. zg.B185]WIM20211.1 GNAT family N-acetyltransferase [Microbacterium sp. zg-B185]
MKVVQREISYVRFEHVAPDETWAEIAKLFISIFAAPPYNESPDELQSIDQWGPDQLASAGGRLVAAGHDGHVIGFALSQRLDQDSSWQRRLDAMRPALDAAITPSRTVIVQELAVDESFRGRGIAKQCVRELLSNRTEHDAVLGVFGQAAQAREMYRHWGFSELGTALIYGGAVTLHALHHKLPWTV